MMGKCVAVIFLATAMVACGCQVGPRHTPWPGDATPFGAAKARRQISTWTWRRGYVAIEPYADIVSSVSMLSRVTKEFVDNCHKADIEVYIAVTGQPAETFDTTRHIAASVKRILKQCDEAGADGVDLHYEGFGAERQMKYIIALAGELHRTGRKLSVSVNALALSDTGAEHPYYRKVLGEVCDQVRVMCYGLVSERGLPPRPTSTPARAREAMQAWLKFVPREKLVMGLPAYSYDVDLAAGSGREVWQNTPLVAPSRIVKQGELADAVNYYIYQDKDGHTHVLYAFTSASTGAYLAIADELDIPAISFWTADRVPPETWQTVRDWMAEYPDAVIEADSDIFTDTITVAIKTTLDGCQLRYTLDGTEPTADSALYTKPLVLSDTATVKARAFGDGRAAGFTTGTRTLRKLFPPPADQPEDVVAGIHFKYFEGPWERMPDFDSLQPVAKGIVPTFDTSHRKQDDFFGFRFTGYIKVPRHGVYTFFVRSDDGLRLWLGDKLVIDDYGFHPAREVRGSIALAPGIYPIKADYFEWDIEERLTVYYQGPGIEKQIIPAEVLFHRAGDAVGKTGSPRASGGGR